MHCTHHNRAEDDNRFLHLLLLLLLVALVVQNGPAVQHGISQVHHAHGSEKKFTGNTPAGVCHAAVHTSKASVREHRSRSPCTHALP